MPEDATADRRPPAATPRSWSWRIASLVVVLGLFAACLAVGARRLGDPDLPWHLAVGRQIADAGAVPAADDLTYTFRGTAYPTEWLGEVALFAALRLAGPDGLSALAAACAALIAWLIVKRSRSVLPVAALAAALALTASEMFLVMRPALLSLSLWAAALALVEGHRAAGPRGGSAGRGLWLLVPLQLVWSAVHGFVLLGALLALGYALYAAACRLAAGRRPALLPAADGERWREVAAVAIAALVATVCGPIGPAVLWAPWRAIEYGGYLTEWTPVTLRFVTLHAPAFAVLAGLTLLAVLPARAARGPAAAPGGPAPPWSVDLFELGLCGGTLALALLRTRMVPVFAIAAAPVVARRLGGHLVGARLGPLLAGAVGLAAAPAILLSPGSHVGRGFDGQRLPVGAVRFAAEHHLRGPLWNFLSFGGWVELCLYPDVRAFIDGRTSYLIPFSFFHEYALAEHDQARFAGLSRRFGFQWALVPAGPTDRFSEPIADDPAFALVYLDDVAAVYVRRDGDNRALVPDAYRFLRHLTAPEALFAAPAADLDNDARHALSDEPRSPRAHLVAAAAALLTGDRVTAQRERDTIEALEPIYAGLRVLDERLASRPPVDGNSFKK